MGAVLALGAPLGLLVVRLGQRGEAPLLAWVAGELARDTATFAYVTLSTMVVFAAFGGLLGRHADALRLLGESDGLTGMANRHCLERRLEAAHREATAARPLSVLLVDVDHLKTINDASGHRAGDLALQHVAAALRLGSRAADTAGRWGGDEFLLIAPDTTAEAARHLAERIRETVAGDAARRATVSVGIATTPGRARGLLAAFLADADAALYRAKERGRDRVEAAG
jgi:diguanylate cyclase (GGDEF)-like protein